jgi:hypothetical protein
MGPPRPWVFHTPLRSPFSLRLRTNWGAPPTQAEVLRVASSRLDRACRGSEGSESGMWRGVGVVWLSLLRFSAFLPDGKSRCYKSQD